MSQKSTQQIVCPTCAAPLEERLILGFCYCAKCEIAVRGEEDMPEFSHAYDETWVAKQERCKDNFVRAKNAVRMIKKSGPEATNALDIGCGTGILVDLLNRNGVQAVGVDSSEAAINFANGTKRGRYYVSDGDLPDKIGAERYGLVSALQLIEHLRDPGPFLEGVKDILGDGGYLLVETPNVRCYRPYSLWRNLFGGIVGAPDHRIVYGPKSLAAMLESHGFEIRMMTTWTYSPIIFADFYRNCRALIGRCLKGRRQTAGSPDEVAASSSDTEPHRERMKHAAKKKARACLQRVFESRLLAALLYLPNRISELNDRGVQLICIARLSIRNGKGN